MTRANRVLLTVVAVVLLAGGAAVALAGFGRLPSVPPDSPLLSRRLTDQWSGWGIAAWLVLAAVGLVIALLGVLLIRAELRVRAMRPISDLLITGPEVGGDGTEQGGGPAGRTRVRGVAMMRGIEQDLARHPKVHRASVELGGDLADPRVHARLDVTAGTEVRRLQSYLAESLARFTGTTGLSPAEVEVEVMLTDRDATRVR